MLNVDAMEDKIANHMGPWVNQFGKTRKAEQHFGHTKKGRLLIASMSM